MPELLTTDADEQLARIDGQEAVRRLVERYSVEDVHRWLRDEAALCCERMPCEQNSREEGQ